MLFVQSEDINKHINISIIINDLKYFQVVYYYAYTSYLDGLHCFYFNSITIGENHPTKFIIMAIIRKEVFFIMRKVKSYRKISVSRGGIRL